jgi:hypothetical protein
MSASRCERRSLHGARYVRYGVFDGLEKLKRQARQRKRMARTSKSSKGHASTSRRSSSSAATPVSEDDPIERCPICEDKKCRKHLLAIFDASGETGEFGVGLCDGPLCKVREIEEVLERSSLAWVQSVRAIGKPEAPWWIMKEPGLKDYFDALGRSSSGGSVTFDPVKYESDEDAAWDLRANSDEPWAAREEFLYETLRSCGWKEDRTETDLERRRHHEGAGP